MMNNTKIYFLNVDLGIRYTGIESSALLRSRLFVNQLGLMPTFITCKYRSQLMTEIEELKKQKKLAPGILVINLYDYLQKLASYKESTLSLYDGEVLVSLSGTQSQRYFDTKNKLKVRVFYNQLNQRLHYIIHFYQDKRWRRDYYHESGSLSCTHLFDKEGKEVEEEIFYRADASICLIKSYSCQAGAKRALVRIQIVDSDGQVIRVMDDENDLIEYFLFQYFADKLETSILLIDKNRSFYRPAINVKTQYGSDKIKVISAIHNLHAVDYHKLETSRINSNYVSLFEDLSQPDALVVQTNAQKQDILQRFGESSKVFAIPHTYQNTFKLTESVAREAFKAVYFARYNSDKKHELAIEAFAKVVAELPQAELHCYGTGNRLDELRQMVSQLGVSKNIFLHGWCDSVAEQYESATLSIISSPSESFSLTIAESLAHGCPVVGFDVPYGPQELVQSGVNGYLVPYENTVQMAEKIIEIMTQPDLQREFSNNARESSKRFSELTVKALWQALFKKIHEEFR